MMARNLTPEAENRRNATEYAVAGGALIGASAATDAAVAADRHRRKMDGPVKAAAKGKFTRRHAGQVGAKFAGRAAFAAGAPLAAYGGYRMVKPKERTPRLDVKRDVVKPVADGIRVKDLADTQARRVDKADLARADEKRLVRRKNTGKNLSIVGGTLGLAALSLRAPEVARAATKIKRLNRPPIKQLASKEPGATKASNTLGIAAIGTGAAGSFNYASQQKLEAKQFRKSLGMGHIKGIGRVRVLNGEGKDTFRVLDSKDTYRLVPRGRLTWVKDKKKPAAPAPKRKTFIENPVTHTAPPEKIARERAARRRPAPAPAQMELPFGKADRDRFLRQHGDRISPRAEEGYKYLKRGRNEAAGSAALSAGLAGLGGYAGASFARSAVRAGSKGRLGAAAGLTALGAAGGGLAGVHALNAVGEGNKAVRWNSKLKKIKAKGKERATAGQYGPGREVGKALGLSPMRAGAGRLRPRKPAIRQSYVGTSATGKKFTVRGSVG